MIHDPDVLIFIVMGKNRFVYLFFALAVILLAWLGTLYVDQNGRSQAKYTEDVEHTYRVFITLRYCEKLLLDAETNQRGYLLTADPHFKEVYLEAISKIEPALNRLRDLTADNPKQRVNIQLLRFAVHERLYLLDENARLSIDKKNQAEKLLLGKLKMDKVHAYMIQMENEENGLLEKRSTAKNHYQSLNFAFLKYALLFACLVCLAAIFGIIRELRIRIRAQQMLEKSLLDLKRSYEEVEQITFTASHDLQEPLRKIRILGTLFNNKYQPDTDPAGKDILARIDSATEKMHTMIDGLVEFTTLLNAVSEHETIDLNTVFADAWQKVIRGAGEPVKLVTHTTLPSITGHQAQLNMLFIQLLTNALKFRDAKRPLEITLHYQLTELKQPKRIWRKDSALRYHEITITDNGIGFDNLYREKIFLLFQRLNRPEDYTGKGTGLAIVKRIMTNHNGYIEASGEKEKGASFRLYFPLES